MFEYTSNIKKVIDNIKLKTLLPANVDNLMLTLSTTTLASNLRRIHNEGLNVDRKKIGIYSLKPIYINPKNSPKSFAPQGKPYARIIGYKEKRKKFNVRKTKTAVYKEFAPKGTVHGQERKTRYFNDGYFGFRKIIGAESGYVNLQLSGGLKSSYRIEKVPYGYLIGFNNSKYALIAASMERKYGRFGNTPIWGMSEYDKSKVKDIVKEYVKTNA